MAKTVAEKLLIKPNSTVWSLPAAGLDRIGPLPEGATRVADPGVATTVFVFADDAAALRAALAAHGDRIVRAGVIWVAYPKGGRADINRDSVWPILGEYGLRPIGQVAVDDVWSALRFRPLAEGEAPFTGR
ncbi:MAG TPA: hypothetical protein VFO73_10845 [Candidatus Limnocylindrales bacterium]|nr:hypothetical protein [Candidatus Limnocylindrales bacterium]